MKLIYLAHPYDGKAENLRCVQDLMVVFVQEYPDYTFYSPLHATGFLYGELPYLTGMEHCFEALSRCDELWLCGDWKNSKGCCMEYGYAKAKGIPVKEIKR